MYVAVTVSFLSLSLRILYIQECYHLHVPCTVCMIPKSNLDVQKLSSNVLEKFNF